MTSGAAGINSPKASQNVLRTLKTAEYKDRGREICYSALLCGPVFRRFNLRTQNGVIKPNQLCLTVTLSRLYHVQIKTHESKNYLLFL